jgi:hypothetical protein
MVTGEELAGNPRRNDEPDPSVRLHGQTCRSSPACNKADLACEAIARPVTLREPKMVAAPIVIAEYAQLMSW